MFLTRTTTGACRCSSIDALRRLAARAVQSPLSIASAPFAMAPSSKSMRRCLSKVVRRTMGRALISFRLVNHLRTRSVLQMSGGAGSGLTNSTPFNTPVSWSTEVYSTAPRVADRRSHGCGHVFTTTSHFCPSSCGTSLSSGHSKSTGTWILEAIRL